MSKLTNTECSKAFTVDPQKWKRHAREVLLPDPEAGRQRGVSRFLSLEDAFKVWLSVYLSSSRRLSIPETRMILEDLQPWFFKKNIFPSLEAWDKKRINERNTPESRILRWEIVLIQNVNDIRSLHYQARGIISESRHEDDQFGRVKDQTYLEEEIKPLRSQIALNPHRIESILNLSVLIVSFLEQWKQFERTKEE